MIPNLASVVDAFSDAVQFAVVSKTAADFEVVEENLDVNDIQGVLLPLTPRALELKPEGQRSWKWWMLYTRDKIELDYVLQDPDGKLYRVMTLWDWHGGGFYQYEIVEGPNPAEYSE